MCSGSSRRRASSADSAISRLVTENGEHGATAICTRAPCARLVQLADEALGVREHGVEVLDELVGREPAVRDAEVHRAARGDDPHAELAGRLHLRLDEAGPAVREHVVVVEDRRAAGERELGEPRARRGVLGLGVDARPDRVELAQPREEVGLLRAGAREGLVEVMVRVDEARRDDRAAEVDSLVRLRLGPARRPPSTRPSSTSTQPRAMLGARVVARDDPATGEEARSRLERDDLEAVDVDEAAVGDLQAAGSPRGRGRTA